VEMVLLKANVIVLVMF
jgi:hypothetical protein